MDHSKKKLSGHQYKVQRENKKKEIKKLTQNISAFFPSESDKSAGTSQQLGLFIVLFSFLIVD